jgi:hypothetical protein
MGKIAVLSTNHKLNRKVSRYCESLKGEFEPVFLQDKIKCLEYLNYELPEVTIFNLSDSVIPMNQILSTIKEDPWLHYGGIIAIHSQDQEEPLEKKMTDYNLIALINESQFDFSFPRVIRILNANRQIIFQRGLQSQLLSTISGSFIIDNDPFDVKTYAYLVSNYLFNVNYINRDRRDRLLVALMELLINAIEHGNCRISYEEKSAWLESGRDIFSLIRLKNKDVEIRDKKVYFAYTITPHKSHITIRDEGSGFDWRKRKKQITEENYLDLHGRGIMMAEHYVQSLSYNDEGNEVRFNIPHQLNESNILPEAFTAQNETVFEDGEMVFTEGEESNFLYYIVSGKLQVASGEKKLATLTPSDLFMGEMSFLLNDKRSATVRSVGQSVLLKISKEAFVNVIKQKPHYGIFLARILAQRLDRLNRLV